MSTTYYVDDGGSATAPYDTWAKAATSLSALDDAVALAAGDVVYIGHDHVCQYVHAANRTITGPTSGLPCVLISATQGSNPPAYQKSSTKQIDTSEGAYQLILDGSFALYGVKIVVGSDVYFSVGSSETAFAANCDFVLGANGRILVSDNYGRTTLENAYVDLAADGTTPRANHVIIAGFMELTMKGATFNNPGYRTGVVIWADQLTKLRISGCDFSGFATGCEILGGTNSADGAQFENCKVSASAVMAAPTNLRSTCEMTFVNCKATDDPSSLYHQTAFGSVVSTAICRTGGATIEGVTSAWLVLTTSLCGESQRFCTPWIYGLISSAGSKTFDLYITNDTADFTDAEVWLEVEYMATADDPCWTLASDQRATITTTAAAQTDDTASTWTGSGPAFTYKQKLSVTATIGETGQYRARVCVGKASIASSSYFYIDPKVTVS